MPSHISLVFFLADIRYKAYRAAKRMTLGSFCGKALNCHLFRDMEESSSHPELARRITKKRLLSHATIQDYHFPETFPAWFSRSEAFEARYQYLLSEMTVSPFTGAMWIPGVAFLQQSNGSLPRMFGSRGGVVETLYPTSALKEDIPVCVAPSRLDYYHWLLEAIPELLHAREFQSGGKILLGPRPARYVVQSLKFLDFPDDGIIPVQTPVHVRQAILTPRWVNSGFIPQVDVNIVRKNIVPRLRPERNDRKIYISRSRTKSRPLKNEKQLEKELESIGFEICFFEELDFAAQMKTCSEAHYLIAPHGAGLSNMIACRRGVKIHEILPSSWPNTCYAKLAVQLGFDYNYTLLPLDASGQPTLDVDATLANISTSLQLA